jgi:hypothetical protein
MKRIIAITLATASLGFALTACSSIEKYGDDTPPSGYYSSTPSETVTPTPTPTSTAVALPTYFPDVPLVSDNYVPSSYKSYSNTAAQMEYKVSAYADEAALESVKKEYQNKGYSVEETKELDGSTTLQCDNDTYYVTISTSKPDEAKFQYNYRIVVIEVN